MHALTAIPPSSQTNPVASLPSAPSAWKAAYYFYRIHDPASFEWLNSLTPASGAQQPQVGRCFGMDVAYVALDLLRWFPSETLLAIPYLAAPPPEYFFVCNSGGQRWWCFVVLRKHGQAGSTLVFDIDPSILLIVGLGLRETHVDAQTGVTTQRTDFAIAPNAAVLCPMDNVRIGYQRMSPQTGEYFRVSEGAGIGSGNRVPTLGDVLGEASKLPQTSSIEVSIGSPVFGVSMGINDDPGLIRLVESLAGAGGAL